MGEIGRTWDAPFVSAFELAKTFLVLGCTAFGGPAVHLALFNQQLVSQTGTDRSKRGGDQKFWLTADTFAELVSFASVLPGPTSTQVSFLIGMVMFASYDPDFGYVDGKSALFGSSLLWSRGGDRDREEQVSARKWFVGGLLSGCMFILPGFLIMLVLSNLGVEYGDTITSSNALTGAILGMASVGWGLVGMASKNMAASTTGGVVWKEVTSYCFCLFQSFTRWRKNGPVDMQNAVLMT